MPLLSRLVPAAILILLQATAALAQEEPFLNPETGQERESRSIIQLAPPAPVKVFIDPGHGGRDLGARGSRMELEKSVALKIARLIKTRLSADDRMEVIISRPEDMDMTLVDRINMANFMRAALYMGIHTDGGAAPQAHPMKVYAAKEKTPDSAPAPAGEGGAWNSLNKNYSDKNLDLARAAAAELRGVNAERGVDIIRCDRLFLGGLNMPAVIVEPVDLSNPEDEMRLDDGDFLKRLADALALAVVDYLMKTGRL